MASAQIDVGRVSQSIVWLRREQVGGAPIAPHHGRVALFASRDFLPPAGPGSTVADNTKDIMTDVGGTVVFADTFPAELKLNLLYSWEYAARWANKQIHDKYGKIDPKQQNCDTVFVHAIKWYSLFERCMQQLHWITKDFDWTSSAVSGDTFTVDKQILAVLQAFLAADGVSLAAVQSAIGVLKGLGANDQRMVLWDSHSNSAGKGSFQMGAIREAGGGLATVRLAALLLDSTEHTTTCFFYFTYKTNRTKVSQATQDLVFNNDAYTMVINGQSAKALVEAAVVTTSNQFISNDGGIE